LSPKRSQKSVGSIRGRRQPARKESRAFG